MRMRDGDVSERGEATKPLHSLWRRTISRVEGIELSREGDALASRDARRNRWGSAYACITHDGWQSCQSDRSQLLVLIG